MDNEDKELNQKGKDLLDKLVKSKVDASSTLAKISAENKKNDNK